MQKSQILVSKTNTFFLIFLFLFINQIKSSQESISLPKYKIVNNSDSDEENDFQLTLRIEEKDQNTKPNAELTANLIRNCEDIKEAKRYWSFSPILKVKKNLLETKTGIFKIRVQISFKCANTETSQVYEGFDEIILTKQHFYDMKKKYDEKITASGERREKWNSITNDADQNLPYFIQIETTKGIYYLQISTTGGEYLEKDDNLENYLDFNIAQLKNDNEIWKTDEDIVEKESEFVDIKTKLEIILSQALGGESEKTMDYYNHVFLYEKKNFDYLKKKIKISDREKTQVENFLKLLEVEREGDLEHYKVLEYINTDKFKKEIILDIKEKINYQNRRILDLRENDVSDLELFEIVLESRLLI